MYKVTKSSGEVISIASRLVRCKDQPNGVKIIADDGPGIIVNGTFYNLPGCEAVTVEEFTDDRALIGEIQAGSSTTEDVYMALAELGQLVAGGADNG